MLVRMELTSDSLTSLFFVEMYRLSIVIGMIIVIFFASPVSSEGCEPHVMPNFPFLAYEVANTPFFISTDNQTMFDFDYENKRMRLIDTESADIIGEALP